MTLQIRGISKTYPNGVQALKGVDLSIAEGDFFALLGPNGAGKSTLISILTSLVIKTSGTVSVFGYDLDRHLTEVKSCIGVVPQEFNCNIFESVLDIVVNQAGFYGVPRQLALQRAEKYLNQLGLWEKRNHTPRALSGGMKRRLMIVRALVHQPKLLILDEPTAGVDIELRRSMWDFLIELNRMGTTIILTTHYLEEAENLCRNIAIIDQGRLVENTSMATLLKRLESERFILYPQFPLKSAPKLLNRKVLWSEMEQTIEMEIQKDENIADMIAELAAQGIRIRTLRNKTNRLEELFLSLTSKE